MIELMFILYLAEQLLSLPSWERVLKQKAEQLLNRKLDEMLGDTEK